MYKLKKSITMSSLLNCSNEPKRFIRRNLVLTLITLMLSLIYSCSDASKNNILFNEKNKEEAKALSGLISEEERTPITDSINGIGYNFVKTASMKCKVSNVLKTVQTVEDIVSLNGGYLIKNEYTTINNFENEILFKKDSILKSINFTPQCILSAKVPTQQLDSVLRKIIPLSEFVEYKKSNANNVKLQLLANKLVVKRSQEAIIETKTNTKHNEQKPKEQINSAEYKYEKQTLSDETQLSILDLIDKINYCQIDLEFYQDASTITKAVAITPTVMPYKPNFGLRLINAFVNGIKIFGEIIIGLVNCWGIFAILFICFYVSKYFYKKYSKKQRATVIN